MKLIATIVSILVMPPAFGASLCFSPVKEKEGDFDSKHRSWGQSFDYRVQVDNGPLVVPSSEAGTTYNYSSDSPLVKIWLGEKIVESFYVKEEWLAEGKSCIYFMNLYETWLVRKRTQLGTFCGC